MRIITDAPIKKGTKVFVRCSLDIPIIGGKIQETYRLESCLQTLKYIIEKGGYPIIAGHMGRPQTNDSSLSTQQLKPYFNEALGENKFELLENLRFDVREEANDEKYSKEIAEKADIYVNESFETCHREHASIVGIPKFIPGYAGFRLKTEIDTLNSLNNPQRPFVSIIGGAKIESKQPVINKLLEIADYVLVGGKIGLDWPKDEESVSKKLVLPLDYAKDNKDIGPKTIEKFKEIIKPAKTIVWSGPLGLFEESEFIKGTKEIAESIAKNSEAFSIIGGGDTINALGVLNLRNNMSFISVGGSAMLQYIVKGTLPGIEALKND